MMFPISRITVRQNYKAPLFLGVGLGLITTLFCALFHQFSDQLTPFVKVMPSGMKAVVGDLALGTTPEGWLGIELFPLIGMVGVSVVAIIFGAKLIGKDEDAGTLELLLASRISRMRICAEKYVSLLALLALPPLIMFVVILCVGPLFDFHPNISHVFAACVSLWILGASFGSLSFAAQAITGKQSAAVAISSGIFLIMYATTITARLIDSFSGSGKWSLIYYYNVSDTLLHGIDWKKLTLLLMVCVICFVVAEIGFRKRDTNV